jgi:hypothetical protein
VRVPFIAILLPLLLLQPALAQQSADPNARSDTGLSEQMTATQFSHIKLWFAGKLGNWKLATYELDLLVSCLNEATSRAPVGVSAEDTARRIAPVRDAIDMKDLPAFTKARSTKLGAEKLIASGVFGLSGTTWQTPQTVQASFRPSATWSTKSWSVKGEMAGTCTLMKPRPAARWQALQALVSSE